MPKQLEGNRPKNPAPLHSTPSKRHTKGMSELYRRKRSLPQRHRNIAKQAAHANVTLIQQSAWGMVVEPR